MRTSIIEKALLNSSVEELTKRLSLVAIDDEIMKSIVCGVVIRVDLTADRLNNLLADGILKNQFTDKLIKVTKVTFDVSHQVIRVDYTRRIWRTADGGDWNWSESEKYCVCSEREDNTKINVSAVEPYCDCDYI